MHYPDYAQLPERERERELMCTHTMHLHICLFGDKAKMHQVTSNVRAVHIHTKRPHTQSEVFTEERMSG